VNRVLLIEDHDAARRGFAELLTAHGYDVREAATGKAGLASAAAWSPDVIVLDLGLPDIDGCSVVRTLKQTPTTAAVPLIALTGADLPDERATALAAGCILHLGKPCSPDQLLGALRRTLCPDPPAA
jgi:CheY-like chemotaxis protein